MAEQNKEERLKEKFMQFQMLQQQMEQLNEHINMLNQQNVELEISKEALKEYGESGDGEMLAPIANGIFVKTHSGNDKNLLVNVGSDVVVEKTSEQVVKMLEVRQSETLKKITDSQKLMEQFHGQGNQIYKEVEALQ
jgi:prefoldin alpha subunit